MAEPEVPVEQQTAPELAPAAQSDTPETQETPTLTRDEVKALIAETWSEREGEIRKELETAYKTLRRGEAKSDVSQKRIDKLEAELLDLSLRGLDPERAEFEKLKRQVSRDADARTAVDPQAELTAFRPWSSSYLEEEGIDPKDPTLVESFNKFGEGWQSQADLKVALTRAVAKVHSERAKAARKDVAEREQKAREEERAKLRNEKREQEGKVDKGTPAPSSARPKSVLAMSPEEWDALQAAKGLRR